MRQTCCHAPNIAALAACPAEFCVDVQWHVACARHTVTAPLEVAAVAAAAVAAVLPAPRLRTGAMLGLL